ncbi:MAG: hypothetical protein KDB23_22100, partial [Planctomycetales bacterium]|nr:hypothetical protein [Planctomycetales bacterium]
SQWGWTANRLWADNYVAWLQSHWPLGSGHGNEHNVLLDFHNLRRPECLLFWLGMVAAFCVGFIPQRKTAG